MVSGAGNVAEIGNLFKSNHSTIYLLRFHYCIIYNLSGYEKKTTISEIEMFENFLILFDLQSFIKNKCNKYLSWNVRVNFWPLIWWVFWATIFNGGKGGGVFKTRTNIKKSPNELYTWSGSYRQPSISIRDNYSWY